MCLLTTSMGNKKMILTFGTQYIYSFSDRLRNVARFPCPYERFQHRWIHQLPTWIWRQRPMARQSLWSGLLCNFLHNSSYQNCWGMCLEWHVKDMPTTCEGPRLRQWGEPRSGRSATSTREKKHFLDGYYHQIWQQSDDQGSGFERSHA